MLLKYVSSATLIAVALAQDQCPDIRNDPHIDLNGPGTGFASSNLDFDRYCGPVSTPSYGYAIARDTSESNTREANCRVKCKDWDVSVNDDGNNGAKLFWLRTKNRWIRTKWLQCYCRERNDGSKVCKYRRRAYNYKEQEGRNGGDDDEDLPLQLSCQAPGCFPPKDIAEFNTGTVDEIRNTQTGEVLCTDCKLNTDRDGTWACYDADGNILGNDVPVPRRGWCELQCTHQPLVNIKKKMICLWPHKVNGADQYKNLWRIYKQLPLTKYKKLMDADLGWKCSADLSSSAISDALEAAADAAANRSLDYDFEDEMEDYEADEEYGDETEPEYE